MQQGTGARGRRVAADRVQALVQVRNAHAVVGIFGGNQLTFYGAQFGVTVQHVIQRRGFQRRNFLPHPGHGPVGRTLEMAGVRRQFAGNKGEQAGFARAIATADAHAPAGMQGKVDVFEQDLRPAAQGKVIESDHPAILP